MFSMSFVARDGQKKVRKAVVPAAGLGTRLLPATKSIPKELLPIVGAPTIHYIAEEAIASGIEELIIVANGSKQAILDYFASSPKLEQALASKGKSHLLKSVQNITDRIRVTTVNQDEPKGLGHAILMAKDAVGDEPFAVLFPDEILRGSVPVTKQMLDVFASHGPVIPLRPIPEKEFHRYGMVRSSEALGDGVHRVFDIIEKPSSTSGITNLGIIGGRYVLPPEIFAILESTPAGVGGEIQLTDAIQTLAKQIPLFGFEFKGERYDTGDALGLLEANIGFGLQHDEIGEHVHELLKRFLKSD